MNTYNGFEEIVLGALIEIFARYPVGKRLSKIPVLLKEYLTAIDAESEQARICTKAELNHKLQQGNIKWHERVPVVLGEFVKRSILTAERREGKLYYSLKFPQHLFALKQDLITTKLLKAFHQLDSSTWSTDSHWYLPSTVLARADIFWMKIIRVNVVH